MAILDSAAIMPRTCVVADQVLVLDTVGSTNTYAAGFGACRSAVRHGWHGRHCREPRVERA